MRWTGSRQQAGLAVFVPTLLIVTGFNAWFLLKRGGWSDLFEGVAVELNGALFDVFLFAVIVQWIDSRREKKDLVREWQEQLDDFKGWKGEESAMRTAGIVRRLVKAGAEINAHCANLTNADLSREDLGGAHLWGADLSGALLHQTNLSGANLSDTNLAGTDFSGANLAGATLGSADLEDAVFDDANLCGADFCASSASSTRRPLPSPAAHNLTRPPNGWFFDKATRFPPGFDPGKSLPLDQLSLYFDDVR